MQGERRGERGDYRGSRVPGLTAGQGTAGGRHARRGRRRGPSAVPGDAHRPGPGPAGSGRRRAGDGDPGDLGQLLDPLTSGPDTLSGADVIFHLAAAVSGECETDFDLGIRADSRATEALLASARAVGT